MSVSDEIMKRMSDSYRRMRNTVRFLLGNLDGFDPQRDAASPADLLALDRWVLERTRELQKEVIAAYRDYEFHLIYQKVHNFCVVDLGGFYLDILKDRLYTLPRRHRARRSAQTAMLWIAEAMVRWLAPILSFTAEEIWRALPGERPASVFLSSWAALPELPQEEAAIDWNALIELRAAVTRELERLREQGAIGAPLDAEVDVYCTAEHHARLSALGEELRFLFITSAARVHQVTAAPGDAVAAQNAHNRAYGSGYGPRRRRNACVAGITGPTSGATRGTQSFAGGVSSTSKAPVKQELRMSDGVATTATSVWRVKLGALRWVPLGLLVILLDQATKAIVESRFELFDVKPILPFLEFTLLYNIGAAFSFLARRLRLAALVLHRPRGRGEPRHPLLAAPARGRAQSTAGRRARRWCSAARSAT